MGRRERMKRRNGMKDREERSKGIEIRISDDFAIIKPTVPFKLEARRIVYYESINRELNKILIFDSRCDTRLKPKVGGCTLLHTLCDERNRNT